MPCNCFGKKKNSKNLKGDTGAGAPYDSLKNPADVKRLDEPDFGRPPKNKDVIATQHVDECTLLGYQPTGSRPSSNLVDSPVSNSRTPSTAPAAASSNNSSLTASPSASPSSERGALRRTELAEKRREFFKDLIVDDPLYKQKYTNGTATLPTSVRARNFGEVRLVRPTSQPNSLIPSPTEPLQAPPPGPHLLRPSTPTYNENKLEDSTFASPNFLDELRGASEEISRRWQMTDEERESTPCSLKNKIKASPYIYYDQRTHSPNSESGSGIETSEITTTKQLTQPLLVADDSSPPSSGVQQNVEIVFSEEPTENFGSTLSSSSASTPLSSPLSENSPFLVPQPSPPTPLLVPEKESCGAPPFDTYRNNLRENDMQVDVPIIESTLKNEVHTQYSVTEPENEDEPLIHDDEPLIHDDCEMLLIEHDHSDNIQNTFGNLPVIPEIIQVSDEEPADDSFDKPTSHDESGSHSSENSYGMRSDEPSEQWQEEETMPLIEDSSVEEQRNPFTPVKTVEQTKASSSSPISKTAD